MKIVIHPKYQASQTFITQIPEIFDSRGEVIYEGRNVVKKFHVNHEEWIVKQYKKPYFIQRLVYSFCRRSKAERAYSYASKLLSLGINTPEGIAYIELNKHGLFQTGYFVSTVCRDTSVYTALIESTDYKHELITALATFLIELHTKGILHGDLNLTNILYTVESGEYKFTLIDTNRSTFKHSLSPKECLINLKRLTHHREVLKEILKEYASQRNWNVQNTVLQVMNALDRFEKRKRVKHFIRGEK